MAKERIPCPKCDGRGIIPQYYYNRKGICFKCWGAKYIMVDIPDNVDKKKFLEDLRKNEKPNFKDNPVKVELPSVGQIKNPTYFPATNSKVNIAVMPKPEVKVDPRIGTVIKGTRGKPDITVTAVIGPHMVGTFTNSKTGETMFTVFPTVHLDKDDWTAYQNMLKDKVGGVYSRFMRKQIFDTDPTEALKKLDGGTVGGMSPEDEKKIDDERKKRREERELRAKVRDMFDALGGNDSVEAWTDFLFQLKNLPDYRGKDQDIKSAENTIEFLTEMENDKKIRDAVYDIQNKYGGIYNNTEENLQKMLKEIQALPDAASKRTAISRIERELKALTKDAGKRKLENEAKKKYEDDLKKREDLVNASVTDDFKDTPLANQIKGMIGDGVKDVDTVTAIGKIVSEKLQDKYKKYDSSDAGIELANYKKEKADVYNRYMDLNAKYKKGDSSVIPDLNAAAKRYHELEALIEKELANREKFYQKAYLDVMSEIRVMGDAVEVNLSADSTNKTVNKKINETKANFPKRWWDISNTRPLDAVSHRKNKSNQGRAWHSGTEDTPRVATEYKRDADGNLAETYKVEDRNTSINLFASTNASVTTHELMHRMEWVNPNIHKLEEAFFTKRTAGMSLKSLGMRASEKYLPRNDGGEWYKPYCGKDYTRIQNDGKSWRRTFELMTMGIQSVVYGDTHDTKHKLQDFDEEYYNFVLGMLASV